MPASTSTTAESRPIRRGRVRVKATASRPPPNAAPCMASMPPPAITAAAAPTHAPDDTPSKSGDTSGLRKMP